MKRLRSSDDLDSYNNNEKSSTKDSNLMSSSRSSSRSFYYKPSDVNTVRKGLISPSSSSARYDRDRSIVDDDNRESVSRPVVRKRSSDHHDFDQFDRRKSSGFDRYNNSNSGNRESYGGGGSGSDRIVHRSESFCGSRREFPKGFRSERDRGRREGSVSSWRRFGSKEFEESGSRGERMSGVGVGGGVRVSPKEFEESSRGSTRNEERMSGAGVGGARASPKGLREVKSPTWSRDSGSEQTRGLVVVRGGGKEEGKVKSGNSKSRSSPTWSKDSESEQSKSVEVGKKSVEVEGKSFELEAKSVEMEVKSSELEAKSIESDSSSEMEEGELQPEQELAPTVTKEEKSNNGKEGQDNVEVDDDHREVKNETQVEDQVIEEKEEPNKPSVSKGENLVKEVGEVPICTKNLNDDTDSNEDEGSNVRDAEGKSFTGKSEKKEEASKDTVAEKLVYMEEEIEQEKGIDLEVKMDEVTVPESIKEVTEENNGGAEVNADKLTESLGQNLKDKGKSVAASPNRVPDSAWVERESRSVPNYMGGEDDMEGPSTRGFELFTSSPVRRVEKAEQSSVSKPKDEKLVLEPLDLSLSLPNVLLPIGATRDTTQAPGSPSHGRSVQSLSTFRTNSDGFTASMTFSGSQSVFHNPSCSLTQNSLDLDNLEQSVHSRPIFQGIDWSAQAQAQNDSKPKDVPLAQRILMNGNNSLHQSQVSHNMPNGQALPGSSKMPNALERQLSFHKQLSGGQARKHDDTRSPSQSFGSHDIGSHFSFEKKRSMREKHGGGLYRSNSHKEQEQFVIGGADFVETVISRIVSEPIHVMARKFHEMTGQSSSCLKESIREIMLNADKQGQLYAFQTALQNRSDLNLDVLLKSHRIQLEILVALKMGLPEYLHVDNSISSSDLAEVFLNLRCRNLTCRSPLPVDECECKVCMKKNGFCSACMCLVCSKFDMASNTCSWVGCDVCLHWCHADCALRESYIRNGRSATAAQGSTEMQFHCVACDHPSEMFGFVKEVFQNFANDWTAETFCKELEYVKRIFSSSRDARGRHLHDIADMMILKLANKSSLPEVYSHIMGFLTERNSSKFGNASVFDGKEQGSGNEGGIAGPSRDSRWLKSVYSEKAPQLERSASLLPSFQDELNDKRPEESELQRSAQKEPLFDELESIVRIKQAEAKMFQARADDARRDAESLKRIAIAKNEEIYKEYSSRMAKLRLMEAEEMRKQKFEEFQALERAHREYLGMKIRMEAEIRDLLLKMEATRRNLAM